ncbi:MAG: hypothetical protein IKT46_06375 [Clostridia bacterium]|nr:hypothetical protein [Clostridia bacterium]
MSAQKKKIIIVFAVVISALVILGVLSLILERIDLFSDPVPEYEFYIPLEDEEYLTDPDYLQMDRVLRYTDTMGQQWFIYDEDSCGELGAKFFFVYFSVLEYGDAQALNELYSDELGNFDPFTPQRTYHKEVKYRSSGEVDDKTSYITYSLDYNIMKNDGSFRRDIGSDMSRTQYVTVYYTEDDIWIESVESEYRK